MSVFCVCEWRSFPSCRCVRAWMAGDGWNWNTDWRHCIHCLILGGFDVLKVSAKPKRPMYEASWVPIVAAILFLLGFRRPRSDYVSVLEKKRRHAMYGDAMCCLYNMLRDPAWGLVPAWNCLSRHKFSWCARTQSARIWKKLGTKEDPTWWDISVLRGFRAYFGVKWPMNAPTMTSGGFWNTTFLIWLDFGAKKMAVAAAEYWSEDND